MFGRLNYSSNKSFKGYFISATVLVVVVVSVLFYISSTRFNEGLNEVKSLVTKGKFEEAISSVNNLKETNKIYLAINTTNLDGINTAIEEHQSCVLNEYPTYTNHSGIQGCVYWMRADDLEKKEVWSAQFKEIEDQAYCKEKYGDTSGYVSLRERLENQYSTSRRNDTRCEYEAFKAWKRDQNSDLLTSQEWDGFTEYCALESCRLPDELNF